MQNELTTSFRECVDSIERELNSHDLYFGHGTDNSADEACWLVSAVLTSAGMNDIADDTPVSRAQMQRINALLGRRISGKHPLAYLLQEAWFAGHCFYVDERVLVPRSPIAELIDQAFEPLVTQEPALVLDLCCGSGCIGIATALAFPQSRVVLADISGDALDVATINIERFGLQNRVETRLSDVYDAIPERFDLILANPPYVAETEYRNLPGEYHNEPALGLVCEGEGLAIPAHILARSADHLTETGQLILETGYTWPQLESRFPRLPFLWLEFEFGGEGVCALSARQLQAHFHDETSR